MSENRLLYLYFFRFFRTKCDWAFQLADYSAVEYSIYQGDGAAEQTAYSALWDLHAWSWKTPRAPCWLWTQWRRGGRHLSLPPPLHRVKNPICSLDNSLRSAPGGSWFWFWGRDLPSASWPHPSQLLCLLELRPLCFPGTGDKQKRRFKLMRAHSCKHFAPSPSSSRGRCFPWGGMSSSLHGACSSSETAKVGKTKQVERSKQLTHAGRLREKI